MRSRSFAFLVLSIMVLLVTPTLLSFSSGPLGGGTRVLAVSNSQYSENLSLYLTSSEALWKTDLSGGNISVGSVSVPQSVSAYSLTLTRYSSWKPQFETFTKYGFALLGSNEPYPDAALLVINTTSSADATALANSLSQRFALYFQPLSSGPGYFTFLSVSSFTTELNTYFWKLVPQALGGFASMFTQQQLLSGDLAFFQVDYSSTYSISFGTLSPLSNTKFDLYTQLGVQASSYNYSSYSQSSTITVDVLGGLISNASVPWQNHFSNFSASMTTSSTPNGGNQTIPDLNATLDFAFPTIQAYRVVTPTLAPSHGAGVSVTIYVTNVSPQGTPVASNVFVNDSWIYSHQNDFNLTVPQTSGNQDLASGQTMTVAYAFTVLASNGTFTLPATPVTWQFTVGNSTVTQQVLLNPETMVVGGANTPILEATASLSGSSIQAGQPLAVNVTIANKGSGSAFNIVSSGLTKQNLPPGSTWSFIANSTSSSLTSTSAIANYSVTWEDSSGLKHSATTNTLNTVFSFGVPGSPAVSLYKSVSYSGSKANVSLTLYNNSPNSLSNLTVQDPVPLGTTFSSAFNASSLHFNNGLVTLNVTTLQPTQNQTYTYSLNISNVNENYVFMPANVSTEWYGVSLVHYSNGYALPLGVVSTKIASPPNAFQGSNATLTLQLTNSGSQPVYQAYLNDSYDSFLQVLKTGSNYAAQLNAGQSIQASIDVNFTGSPGQYNLAAPAATFIFSGYSENAVGHVSAISIYSLVESNITYSALKVEENHNINVTITVNNPSNVTVNNIVYSMPVPAGLRVLYGGSPNFSVTSMGPNSSYTHSFIIITSEPDVYQFTNASLTFSYQGHQLKGVANSLALNIADDIKIRYGIPVIIALVVVLGTVLYVQRLTKKK
ncbi:MAG: hypothetical protein JRN15_08650 [Nitrososphaerota archaeon]|nr:hypothetical protein [Nitrososphaerota archaeon]